MSTSSPGSGRASAATTPSEPHPAAARSRPDLLAQRAALLERADLRGSDLCRELTALTDQWFASLFEEATSTTDGRLALVAVGGYGRGELSPASDLDLVLLHDGHPDIRAVADALWYPVWDTGLKLGHAVRTTKEALQLAADDLDTATSLLRVRRLAGDPDLATDLAERARGQWQRRAKRWLARLADAVEARHAAAGEVAFLLEPDLKDGRGGLRDVHALGWAEAARTVLLPDDPEALREAYEVLLSTRVELQRTTARAGDRLLLQEQDAVAAALGAPDADALMQWVADASRQIAWTSDETWDRIRSSLAGPLGRTARRDRRLDDGVVLRDGSVHLGAEADPAEQPGLVLRVAAAAAHAGARIDRETLDRLAAASTFPDPWPDGARDDLVSLLGAGTPAISIWETLDRRDLVSRVLPEWEPVRSRPQRNAYHRFTVDRHLCEAAAQAAALTRQVARPDLLLLGAWLHDLGKGYPGDHTQVGMELVATIGPRMGLVAGDVDVLVALVEHHLLLPDIATRRDLDDDATIEAVAAAVGSALVLELLAALTEADSIATGPSAWSRWKAGLVSQLVSRVAHVLEGGRSSDVTADADAVPVAVEAMAARGEHGVVVDGMEVTVVTADRPGVFARVAGALALAGLDVLAASATSSERAAVSWFRVEPTLGGEVDGERIRRDVERALAGRLSIDARLADRARTYRGSRSRAATAPEARLLVDNAASETATVLEVRAADAVGILYFVTKALADLDLDIRSAKVQTLGHEVVDTFYVTDAEGKKVTDADHLAEIEAAVLHAAG